MKETRVTINQAAAEIGCNPQRVREKMYCGEWDLGAVIKLKGSVQKARYYVFRGKLDAFLGL